MTADKTSKVIRKTVMVSPEMDEFVEEVLIKRFGLFKHVNKEQKCNKIYSLGAVFAVIKIWEILEDARYSAIGYFESTDKDVTPEQIKNVILTNISKYEKKGRVDLKTMFQTMDRFGEDELFKQLLAEAFNGENSKKKEEIEV